MSELIEGNGAIPFLGMNLTQNPLALKQGQASFILNGVPRSGANRNAKGNRKTFPLSPGFKYLGKSNHSPTVKIIFSLNPITKEGEIGYYQNDHYEKVVTSTKFNFQINKPIRAVSKIGYDKHVIVYFTDAYNNRRRLDLNDIPRINGDLDVDAISVSQNYSIPDIKLIGVTENGALLSGGYYVYGEYSDANGNALTSPFTPVGAIPVTKNALSDSFSFIEGVASNQVTNKAIAVEFAGLDLSYQYYNVGIVRVMNGVKRAFIVSTFPTSQSRITITGQGKAPIEIDPATIDLNTAIYTTAKTVEACGNVLVWGGMKAKKQPNLQIHFNNLKLQWQVDRQRADDNQNNHVNPINTAYKRVFRMGEAYGFGVVIRWKNGSKSQVYQVIGRRKNQDSGGSVVSNTVDQYGVPVPSGQWDSYNGYVGNDSQPGKERWQQFNTAYIKGTDLAGTTGPAEYGEFGYYESTYTYPNDPLVWGDLAGKPILLHRMPDSSVIHLHDEAGSRGVDEPVYLNFLGVRFLNIEEVMAGLPADVRNEMQGYEIVVTDRLFNKSVIASGLIYNTPYTNWRTQDWGKDDVRLYPNYPFNCLTEDRYHEKVSINGDSVPQHKLQDRYRKDVFTFLGSDTSFKKTGLVNARLQVHGELYGTSKNYWRYLSPYPKFFDRTNSADDDCAGEMIALGWYNNFKKVKYGNVSRQLKEAMYVPFNVQVSTGNIGVTMHNIGRESTVVLGVDKELQDPSIVDKSRAIQWETDVGCVRERPFQRAISAYYASIQNFIDNQYGNVFDMKFRYTNFNNFNVRNKSIVFGGDTFVGRFTMKRQMQFYTYAQSYIAMGNGDKAIRFDYGANIPGYGYNYNPDGNNARNNSTTLCREGGELGIVPILYSSIPIFYTEADDNINLRLNGELPFETFYQNLLNGSVQLDEFLGIKHVDKDNYFVVNTDFSDLNTISTYSNGSPFYKVDADDQDFYGRVVYSLASSSEDIFDNWRVYLPLNYYDFPKTEGRIVDIRYLGQYRTLFRLENGLFIDQLYTTMESSESSIRLGSGKLFSRPPEAIVTADNRNAGTNHAFEFNNTPFGAFMTSAQSGEVYLLGQSLKTISGNDAQTWFNENLPLKLATQIDLKGDIDVVHNGLGLLSEFDNDHKLWFLTKKDYSLVNPEQAGRYRYENGVFYYDNGVVELSNTSHFRNCSFTISYSPVSELWYSYHSFIPDFYMSMDLSLYTGINTESDVNFWKHDSKRFCEYYGKTYQHIVEMGIPFKNMEDRFGLWYAFITKAYKSEDNRRKEQYLTTFHKAIIYNSKQCSGLLKFVIKDELDLSTILKDLQVFPDMKEVELKRFGSQFCFSGVYDISNSSYGSEGFFTTDWNILKNQYFIDKVLDPSLLDYKRDYKEMLALNDLFVICRYIYEDNDVELNTYFVTSVDKLSTV
jgi:hypothetical protein